MHLLSLWKFWHAGEVYLTRQLNYDAGQRDFSVQIRALDGTRSATVTLSISVSDVNDMAPEFLRVWSHTYNLQLCLQPICLNVESYQCC